MPPKSGPDTLSIGSLGPRRKPLNCEARTYPKKALPPPENRLTDKEVADLIVQWEDLGRRTAMDWWKTNRDIPLDDIRQAVYLGFIEAGRRFDKTRGIKFSTFAQWHLDNEVRRVINTTRGWSQHGNGRNGRVAGPRFSRLDLIKPKNGQGGGPGDWFPEREEREPTEKAVADFWGIVESVIDRRSLLVLRKRVNGTGLREIGKELGISRERVRQIESRALERLRDSGKFDMSILA